MGDMWGPSYETTKFSGLRDTVLWWEGDVGGRVSAGEAKRCVSRSGSWPSLPAFWLAFQIC